jgi:hypothetical protein
MVGVLGGWFGAWLGRQPGGAVQRVTRRPVLGEVRKAARGPVREAVQEVGREVTQIVAGGGS